MSTTIVKQFRFEAWHRLPNHNGKCRNMHGHSYLVEVGVQGQIRLQGSNEGMVMDFAELSGWWRTNMEMLLDHNDAGLNGILPSRFQPPTAENITGYIFSKLHDYLSPEYAHGPRVEFVRLWETNTSYAEVRA